MRHIVIASCLVACCSTSSQALAQNCKPDASETDAITKEKFEVWAQVLSSRGGLMSTSNTTIMGQSWRRAGVNYLQLKVQRTEQSPDNAAVTSALQGAVGKPFFFGFKTGEPLKFEVAEVENAGGVRQGLFAATGVRVSTFRTALSNSALGALRESLSSRQIDAVRIELAGDVRIEARVDENNGKKMMQKFSCFYQSLEKQGIDLSAAAASPSQPGEAAAVGGKQADSQKPAMQLTIDQVIQMVAAKLPDDVIVTTIQNSGSKFDLTPEALIKLKTSGVSDAVIRAMTR